MNRFLASLGISILCAASAGAECASDAAIAAFVADFEAKVPTQALVPDGTMEDARCTQAKLSEAMQSKLGPIVGYKAGLTSAPVQARFGATEPVGGVLYEKMLLEDGAEVPMAFGARPLFEADLLLVINDSQVNEAQTPEEVMAHVSAVRPFIELPDLTVAEDQPINGVTLTAMGVAPRLGVMGAEIPVEDPAAMLDALAGMQVTVRDAKGAVMAEASGASVLGNPVNSVLWLMSKGYVLKAGDLISVGSIGPLLPPAKAQGGASVTYVGLPGDPTVSVVFTP
ncbi:2-oxo-hept-3-ene-1,7-dioate hydratase [Sagittula marina]|uniref:2-oxo-hept-3-ene-1,7-dioate hydratase n=1 Tax=Sagittula marina TaxID=943940 RepID=A0A7W6GRH2_9RHOB|nr:fumarylacetoacetate hydrolase family protein [Sagittula marina]MBB3984905.1 2-oxo-hept-3-ene-1,7-dioate hydratase [Sagittula marina]